MDRGHPAEAFIQLVSGAELAISHLLSIRITGASRGTTALLQSIFILPLKVRLAVLLTGTSLVPQETVENALRAIDLRNEIVHEGKQPNTSSNPLFFALVQCIKVLLALPELKTPVITYTNELTPPEYQGRQAIV